jgi:hypothetical protein
MAKLDRPLYGDEATGTLARALAFRQISNPPDEPGATPIYFGSVAKIPTLSSPPSVGQYAQRLLFASAIAAWHALTYEAKAYYKSLAPNCLSGFNFFLRLFLLPYSAYLGFCIFGTPLFQLAPGQGQPLAIDYDVNFPPFLDEFPVMVDGAHSCQAWLFNRMYDALLRIQGYLILHKLSIEVGG